MHEGLVSLQLGLKGIPRVSESIIVARNVALAAATGGHIHICHVSARESVEAIREGKRSGVRVTAEVTPHHLTMTDEAVRGYDTHAKMKPPLCAEEDRLALVAGLEDGTIDCIATDHAPHSSTAKNNVFDAAPFGIIGMESAFPVLYTTFVETGRWTPDFLIERMTNAPAKIVDRRIGSLQTGMPADIVLLEMGTEYTFDASYIGSKSSNCPWLGQRLKGRIAATMVDGKLVHRREEAFGGAKALPRKRAASKRK
jgi:dihydroorotase